MSQHEKWLSPPLLASAAASACCVNTFLSNNGFHFSHCVMQKLRYVSRTLCGQGVKRNLLGLAGLKRDALDLDAVHQDPEIVGLPDGSELRRLDLDCVRSHRPRLKITRSSAETLWVRRKGLFTPRPSPVNSNARWKTAAFVFLLCPISAVQNNGHWPMQQAQCDYFIQSQRSKRWCENGFMVGIPRDPPGNHETCLCRPTCHAKLLKCDFDSLTGRRKISVLFSIKAKRHGCLLRKLFKPLHLQQQ